MGFGSFLCVFGPKITQLRIQVRMQIFENIAPRGLGPLPSFRRRRELSGSGFKVEKGCQSVEFLHFGWIFYDFSNFGPRDVYKIWKRRRWFNFDDIHRAFPAPPPGTHWGPTGDPGGTPGKVRCLCWEGFGEVTDVNKIDRSDSNKDN